EYLSSLESHLIPNFQVYNFLLGILVTFKPTALVNMYKAFFLCLSLLIPPHLAQTLGLGWCSSAPREAETSMRVLQKRLKHTHTHTHTHTSTQTHTHSHIHTYTHTHTHVSVC